MSEIWDSHVHLFSSEMSAQPVAWAATHNEPIWSACVAPPGRRSIQGWADANHLLRDMDNAGIDHVVLLGWYWENQATCSLQNRLYATLIKAHPDRLMAFAGIRASEPFEEELDWCRDNGFVGLGEIHPQAQGFHLKDDCWQSVLKKISDWDWLINLHVTDPDSKPHPGKVETPLMDYFEMAAKWPEQIFILAHLGACLPLKGHVNPANVYYDCAAVPLLYPAKAIKGMVDAVGRDRILWGTDYPLFTFPRTQKKPSFVENLKFLNQSGLAENELRKVLTSNAKEIFHR